MATEILRPQNCLVERIRVPPASFPRRKSYGNNCSNYYYHHHQSNQHVLTSRSPQKPVPRPDQRKRVLVGQPVAAEAATVLRRTSADDSRVVRSSGSAVEKLTILRRGKSLDSAATAVTGDMYAGSAFAMSPSPSALPLPSFSTKKQASSAAAVDDSATRDLRRLLRLE